MRAEHPLCSESDRSQSGPLWVDRVGGGPGGSSLHFRCAPSTGRNFHSSASAALCMHLALVSIYENFPHALSVAHQMIMLPPRMTTANESHA